MTTKQQREVTSTVRLALRVRDRVIVSRTCVDRVRLQLRASVSETRSATTPR
jgi:hypothetical protein